MRKEHKMLNIGARSGVFERDMADLAPVGMAPSAFAALSEAARLDLIRDQGTVPDICGPDIPIAPARGAYRVFRPVELVPGSAGTARPAGYQGRGEDRPRAAIIRADVFDEMAEAARKHPPGVRVTTSILSIPTQSSRCSPEWAFVRVMAGPMACTLCIWVVTGWRLPMVAAISAAT